MDVPYSSPSGTQRTNGHYQDENAAKSAFDAFIESTGVFAIYKEVWGNYQYSPAEKENKNPRIDRILCPLPGKWESLPFGLVGVEIKRSHTKIGPPLSQCLDYKQASFKLNSSVPVRVLLDYVFLFPCEKTENEAGSFTAQNRIGTVRHNSYFDSFDFFSGNQLVFRVFRDGRVEVRPLRAGKRRGSR